MTLPDTRPDLETTRLLWIGTYAGGGGAGVYPLSRTGVLGAPYPNARNASFGTYSSRFDVHYLVDEQDAERAVVLLVDQVMDIEPRRIGAERCVACVRIWSAKHASST
ncbi:MAG: hypothetical protein EOP67_26805, partial [Sphingomonas sp.]